MLLNRFSKLGIFVCALSLATAVKVTNASEIDNKVIFKIQDIKKVEQPNGKSYCSFDIYFKNMSALELSEFTLDLEWNDEFDINPETANVKERISGAKLLPGQQIVIEHKTESSKCFMYQDSMTININDCRTGKLKDTGKCKGLFELIEPLSVDYFEKFSPKAKNNEQSEDVMSNSEYEMLLRDIDSSYNRLLNANKKTLEEIKDFKK